MSIEVMKKAVGQFEYILERINRNIIPHDGDEFHETLTALRQAIKEAALEGLSQTSREIEDIPCKDHPDAPHGFMRDESHSSGRYVCECEAWEPDDMAHRAGGLSVEQEPVLCECHRCIVENDRRVDGILLSMTKMILCPECGFKRCPKASDHRLACTGSNEAGQAGSIYPAPMSTKPENIDTKSAYVDGVDIDLLRQSEQEGWRWARECEAEVKRLNKEHLDAIDRAYFAGKQAGIAEAIKREWVELTDKEIEEIDDEVMKKPRNYCVKFAHAISAALKERNT